MKEKIGLRHSQPGREFTKHPRKGFEFRRPTGFIPAMLKNPVSLLRVVSLSEGISYLVLLGIAMPLKYGANMPEAVRIVGAIHGALFVILCIALLRAALAARWPISRAGLVFLASLIPFAPLWLDRRMKAWQSEFSQSCE